MSSSLRNTDPTASVGGDDFSTLFDLLPVGAYRSTPQGRVLRANAALVRFNGYASEAELLAHCGDVSTSWYVDRQQRQRFAQRLEQDGQVIGMVSEVYRHFTRERAWVSENAHVVRNADGSVRYYEGTIEEITDRVQSQMALQRSEALLRLITQHLPCMVYRLRVGPRGERRFDFVSEGVRGLYGVEPEAVMADGDLLVKFRHPDDTERVDLTFRQGTRAGSATVVEFRVVLPDGTLKWLQTHSRPVPSQDDGEPMRIGVVIDVTAQKQASEWRLAVDRAEAADRAKTQLLSRVSHELRTPLNAVLGFGELLENDATLDPRHHRWVQHIVASGRHLLGLVDDVLDVSAAQAGQLNLAQTALDLRAALHEAWTMLAVAGTAVTLQEAPDSLAAVPPVRADPRRLRQVLSNLLSNAIKYNRPGGRIEVALRTEPADDGSAQVLLRIADTGQGLTADQLARLFTPFERLGAQHTGVPGTGLGLALSRQLMEAMGGRIEASSTPGVGTVFELRLPAAGL